jgi:hypothetical protein
MTGNARTARPGILLFWPAAWLSGAVSAGRFQCEALRRGQGWRRAAHHGIKKIEYQAVPLKTGVVHFCKRPRSGGSFHLSSSKPYIPVKPFELLS